MRMPPVVRLAGPAQIRGAVRSALLALAALAALVAMAACGDPSRDARRDPTAATAPVAARAGVVDSTLPIAELLARFRSDLPDTPAVLAGGAASPEALARALLAAVRAHDTTTLRALTVTRAEFAWLYYPHTKFTAPPYALAPELVWITTRAASEKGAGRLLARFGGRALRLEALECPDRPEIEGPNTILRGCRVRLSAPDSAARELQLFGALLGRDGRYKFLSFANDL